MLLLATIEMDNNRNGIGEFVQEELQKLKNWVDTAPELLQKQLKSAEEAGILRYTLINGDVITCVYWNHRYFITGTDIVKILKWRFHAHNRPIHNMKKFEEGIFSDLRNLKPSNNDAVLEEPKSLFLNFLSQHNCIRTHKKQKVFFWYKVPHDHLFKDAMERILKREARKRRMDDMIHEHNLQKQYALAFEEGNGFGRNFKTDQNPYFIPNIIPNLPNHRIKREIIDHHPHQSTFLQGQNVTGNNQKILKKSHLFTNIDNDNNLSTVITPFEINNFMETDKKNWCDYEAFLHLY